MLLEERTFNFVAAWTGCKIVLKPEQEMAVRALLNGNVLPTGYSPRKKRFCHCQKRFQKALHHFARQFQGSVIKYPISGMKTPFEIYKSKEEALRNTRQL